jgi:hypothetical protein
MSLLHPRPCKTTHAVAASKVNISVASAAALSVSESGTG